MRSSIRFSILDVALRSAYRYGHDGAGILIASPLHHFGNANSYSTCVVTGCTGISYEVIKLAGRPQSAEVRSMDIAPGLWLQKLTCQEPDEDQIEVAIEALTSVLEADGA